MLHFRESHLRLRLIGSEFLFLDLNTSLKRFSCLNVFQPFTSDCMRSLCSVQRFV